MCVKEDITLSDYTRDKDKIEICDEKAQAQTLNTKYNLIKTNEKACKDDLEKCNKEKVTLLTDKTKCEKEKDLDVKAATLKA